jgi:hypothetical protein
MMNKGHLERPVGFTEKEICLAAETLAKCFVRRRDVYARQTDQGSYYYLKKPLTRHQIVRHIRGDITLGVYVLNKDSKTSYTVIDADDDTQFEQLLYMANKLSEVNIPCYMEKSRRGGHLWFFFTEPVSGIVAKTFGEELLVSHRLELMEVFPKQEELGSGPGSLIRLPFGIHRKSGKRYPFINIKDGLPMAPDLLSQIMKLSDVHTVPIEGLTRYTEFALNPRTNDIGNSVGGVWERIRGATPAIVFIGRYIELKPTPTGGVGYCPFHEDQHRSFGVHAKGNYWHCFAGCGGGSIIDFWMKWKNLEIGEAVCELKNMLGVE